MKYFVVLLDGDVDDADYIFGEFATRRAAANCAAAAPYAAHQCGMVVVAAETKDAALKKAQDWRPDDRRMRFQ